MKLPVVWIPEAESDLADAAAWYASIGPDLGERFSQVVGQTIELIARNPLAWQVIHKQIRRAGLWRFPYGIFFRVETDRIVVIACMHGRRNPKRWRVRGSAG
ncbi:MAG: type II toxin-antitoxin system RelE/ParE family toxin [Bryobacteraceae bacterium]